jgi:RNase P subunit RPR2
MSATPIIDKEIARKILDRDVLNLVNRAREGRPLTPAQRTTIQDYAGLLDKQEVLDALQQVKGFICKECATVLEKLIMNISDG